MKLLITLLKYYFGVCYVVGIILMMYAITLNEYGLFYGIAIAMVPVCFIWYMLCNMPYTNADIYITGVNIKPKTNAQRVHAWRKKEDKKFWGIDRGQS